MSIALSTYHYDGNYYGGFDDGNDKRCDDIVVIDYDDDDDDDDIGCYNVPMCLSLLL